MTCNEFRQTTQRIPTGTDEEIFRLMMRVVEHEDSCLSCKLWFEEMNAKATSDLPPEASKAAYEAGKEMGLKLISKQKEANDGEND